MKLPASQALYAYWLSLRQGRRAPERNDLDPTAMRHMLAQTFLLEVEPGHADARRLPIRLSGTKLDALFSRDLKGSDFFDLWAQVDQVLLRGITEDALDGASPVIIGGRAGPEGAAHLGFELLLLPLRHLGNTHARILGGLAFANTPTWLGLRAARPFEVASWRMLEGAEPAEDGVDAVAGAAPHIDRRARLVVLNGGRSAGAADTLPPQARVKPALSRWVNRR